MNTFAQIRQVSIMLGEGWRFIDRNLPGEKVSLWRGSERIVVDAAGQVRGASFRNAKLSVAKVRKIQSRRGVKQLSLAAEFGVHRNTIYKILSGRRWANVA